MAHRQGSLPEVLIEREQAAVLTDAAYLEGGEAMSSLYDDLSEKLKKDPRVSKRGGARYDLGLLLFNARDSLHELWEAADRYIRFRDTEAFGDLHDAVEKLRPIFGERSKP